MREFGGKKGTPLMRRDERYSLTIIIK